MNRMRNIQNNQGLSGSDPFGQFVVEGVALNPVFKALGTAGLYTLGRYGESLTGFARPQNWARAKLLTREMDRSPFGTIGSLYTYRRGNELADDLDIAYETAVNSGNKAEALRLLEQAYLNSGIPKSEITTSTKGNARGWFHGSEWGNHTIFDSSAMNSTIGGASAIGRVKGNFLTTDLPSATRYAGGGRYLSVIDPKITTPITFTEKIQGLFGMYKPRLLYPAERVERIGMSPKPERLFDTKGKPPIDHLNKTDKVVYPMYVNPGNNPIIFDFEGNPWSQSPINFPNNFYLKRWIRDDAAKTYREEIFPFGSYEEAEEAWLKDPINVYRNYNKSPR